MNWISYKNIFYNQRTFKRLILLIGLIVSLPTIANDEYPNWSFKGFGTLGLAWSDNDTLGFLRDRPQTHALKKSIQVSTDSRLGLQLDIGINDDWHITTQFIIRDHAGDFGGENLDWAFLSWYPTHDLEIRAGRMGTDAFVLSDYRDVGYAYPWMRPNHEFYANIPTTHYDGVYIKKTFFLENGDLSFGLGGGYTTSQLSEQIDNYNFGGPLFAAIVKYQTTDWRLRAGYVQIWQDTDPTSDKVDFLRSTLNNPTYNFLIPNLNQLTSRTQTKTGTMELITLGAVYDDGTWLVHTEFSYLNETGMSFVINDTLSSYLSIGRRISDVTLFATYGISQAFANKVTVPVINPALASYPPQVAAAANGLSQGVNAGFNNNHNVTDQQSISLGLRWDFYPKIAFKAQWTHFWLGENGASSWETDLNKHTPNDVNIMSFGFDFIF